MLSLDFIAGLVAGEGSFMRVSYGKKQTVFVFQLKMHASERPLFEEIKQTLGLKGKIYEYNHQNRHYVLILVRNRNEIENIIIPTFSNRLHGLKKIQFDTWKNNYIEKKKKFAYTKHG